MVPCLAGVGSVGADPHRGLCRGTLRTIPGQSDQGADHGDDDENQGHTGNEAHERGTRLEMTGRDAMPAHRVRKHP